MADDPTPPLIVAAERTRLVVRQQIQAERPNDRRTTIPAGLCHALDPSTSRTVCGRPDSEFHIFDDVPWSHEFDADRCLRCQSALGEIS